MVFLAHAQMEAVMSQDENIVLQIFRSINIFRNV